MKLLVYLLFLIFFGLPSFAMELAHEQKVCNAKKLLELIRKNLPTRADQIKTLLKEPIDLDYLDTQENITPLRAAIACDQLDTATLLLTAGATAQPSKDQLCPLGTAIARGFPHFIPVLLAHGAEVNSPDASGGSPVLIATESDKPDCLQALLDNGGDITTKTSHGKTMLIKATLLRKKAIVKTLLEYGADPNEMDAEGYTPLQLASTHGLLSIIESLLAHKAMVGAPHRVGECAMHMAASNGRIKSLELLLNHSPDSLDASDFMGRTPLTWAAHLNQVETVAYLLEKGANPTLTLINGTRIIDLLSSYPQYKESYLLCKNSLKKAVQSSKERTKKNSKKKRSKKTYNQRQALLQENRETQDPINSPATRLVEIVQNHHPKKRAALLNNLLVSSDDGSSVMTDDGKQITFCYKHLGENPTDLIYCLRGNTASVGPRQIYHLRVIEKRTEFLRGARDLDTILHTQPEALDRMYGQCIGSKFTDKRGRLISNKLFFGKKLIEDEWAEGIYILGYTRIAGEYTCYHSFFKRKRFVDCLQELSPELSAEDKEILEQALN